jgi:hypothetical protein
MQAVRCSIGLDGGVGTRQRAADIQEGTVMRALPLVLIALTLLPACSESKKETRQERREERREARENRRERGDGGARGGRRVERFDVDNDGTITRDEFKGRPRRFERLDKNSDGKLTSDEF